VDHSIGAACDSAGGSVRRRDNTCRFCSWATGASGEIVLCLAAVGRMVLLADKMLQEKQRMSTLFGQVPWKRAVLRYGRSLTCLLSGGTFSWTVCRLSSGGSQRTARISHRYQTSFRDWERKLCWIRIPGHEWPVYYQMPLQGIQCVPKGHPKIGRRFSAGKPVDTSVRRESQRDG
jgi:hypothetical protein